jgi:hypothetical protein
LTTQGLLLFDNSSAGPCVKTVEDEGMEALEEFKKIVNFFSSSTNIR